MSDPIRKTTDTRRTAGSRTIELWHAPVAAGHPGRLERQCQAWLEASEHARAEELRQPTSRNQHIIGRGMARRLLAAAAVAQENVGPENVRLNQSPLGKPFVVAPTAAKRPFNIAHTDGLAVCAVSPDAAAGASIELLGVDVERFGRRTDPELARRFFSRPEYDLLSQHTDPDVRGELFLRIWTLKESFIKAIGTGLQTPLADFAFVDIESSAPRIRLLNPKLQSELTWSFFLLHPRPGFVAAVAVASHESEPAYEVIARRFEELLDG